MQQPVISVITPTYNRAHLLERLHTSLRQQTCKHFEWLLVDDGSTDGTEQLAQSLQSSGDVPMRYFKKSNGGKHTAVNRGVREAQGELVLILDSDDSLPPDALDTIWHYWQLVRGDASFGGVAGYMAHHDGTVIGHGCDADVIDCTTLEFRFKHHGQGDMAEAFRTAVLREFPFPEVQGERFCPEALVWNRIATRYRLRYFRKVVYYRDYLDGGLTDRIVRIRMDSPLCTVTTYQELNGYDIPFAQKVKAAINYWRFYPCLADKATAPRLPWHWLWARPLGWLMHRRDQSLSS